MVDLCALCLLPPNCPSNRRKLKKLFGDSFSTERSILQALLAKKDSFFSFHSDAVVCIFCQRALSKIHRLEQELKRAVSEVDVKLEQLCQACVAMHIINLNYIIMNLKYLIIIKLSVVCSYVLASTWPHSAMFQTSTSSGDLQSALVCNKLPLAFQVIFN